MSGWVAIIDNQNGPRVAPQTVTAMGSILDARGPDGRFHESASGGTLMATALNTGDPDGQYPLLSDPVSGHVIAGDIRLDARDHLRSELKSKGFTPPPNSGDIGLVLTAYRCWQDRCPDHLSGDFGWVLWDPGQQTVFAARDPFGVKPAYWAMADGAILISNTLSAICTHPSVPITPDDATVADFLIAGHNRRPTATYFQNIHAIPPGHYLKTVARVPRTTRYWQVGRLMDGSGAPPSDPIDAFRETMTRAVADRWPTGPAGLLMSGGLDSTCVAATARDLPVNEPARGRLTAVTFGFGHQLADPEPAVAASAAAALGIDHLPVMVDDLDQRDIDLQEPAFPIMPGGWTDAWDRPHGPDLPNPLPRIVLTGHGGDPAFDTTPHSFGPLIRWAIASGGGWQLLRTRITGGRWPALGIRSALRRRTGAGRRTRHSPYPPYAASSFEAAVSLRDCYRRWHQPRAISGDAWTASALADLADPGWTALFEAWDAGATGRLLAFRHPFFDQRVLKLVLSLPVLPWRAEKTLIRRAMTNRLPGAVVQRPKTALAGMPPVSAALPTPMAMASLVSAAPGLDHFLNIPAFLSLINQSHRLWPEEIDLITRPLALAQWLVRLSQWTAPQKEIPHATRVSRKQAKDLQQSAAA